MTLRTRLNLVVAGLSGAFMLVLIAAQVESAVSSVREETEASNRVAALLLGQIAAIYSRVGGPDLVLQFLEHLGRVRGNDVTLVAPGNREIYRSPAASYQAGREAPRWFTQLLAPAPARQEFPLLGGITLVVESETSRAVLEAWDAFARLAAIGAAMLAVVNGMAFWLVARVLEPFPVIAAGLQRIEQGDLHHRLPPLAGVEANAIGMAFNRMAQAIDDKVRAELKAQDAEARLSERRELASLADQRVEEERRLIAHELHDEFGQSVTAIRSLALTIVRQTQGRDAASADIAGMISAESARLYDAMHGLIPRLAPSSLDKAGLGSTLENLVRDWQRRHPGTSLSLRQELPTELGSSATLAIYRVAQEGLINALRHAQATRVDIEVRAEEKRVFVAVADDGVGLPEDWLRPGHFGLRGLAERVAQLGGKFDIGNGPEGGVRLEAEIPWVSKS